MEIRDARPEDAEPAAALLYESAAPYYDVYAGGRRRAIALLERAWPKTGHTASFECTRVAVNDRGLIGVCAAFPIEDGERCAGRFVAVTLPRIPPWRWPRVLAHLRAAGRLAPTHPQRSWYVDALAVAAPARREGVARALLDDASAQARRRGLRGVALDTGLSNTAARKLYEATGFERGAVRHAPNERVARAIGGPGFVSYFRSLG